jgi:hypothetical protein
MKLLSPTFKLGAGQFAAGCIPPPASVPVVMTSASGDCASPPFEPPADPEPPDEPLALVGLTVTEPDPLLLVPPSATPLPEAPELPTVAAASPVPETVLPVGVPLPQSSANAIPKRPTE